MKVSSKNNRNVFWKEFRSRTDKKTIYIPDCIDGVEKPEDIADIFADKFSAVSGATNCNATTNCGGPITDVPSVELEAVSKAIGKLKPGLGPDGINANHLKHADDKVCRILAKLYYACFLHSYIPKAMLTGVIKPRVKNKFGDLKSFRNYREVMNSSMFLKVLEYMLLPTITEKCPVLVDIL